MIRNTYLRLKYSALILALPLAGCGGSSEDSAPVINLAPTASSVTITDNNGGDIEVGDSLTGNYTYNDVEGDTEGVSTYRWLRNGVAIGGATASTYTLVVADSDQFIAFEVTPIATTGTIVGDAVTSSSLNAGMISHKNFSVLASELYPAFFDPDTGNFTAVEVTITVTIGDRENQLITDAHTIFFHTEWGLIEPSCVTNNSKCSVTWRSGSPDTVPVDYLTTITAYAVGEESFTDTNTNSLFDDADSVFDDLEEPYIDVNSDGVFGIGDTIIDVVNGNDLTGINTAHDIGDTFFNGPGCTHSSLCSTVMGTVTVWGSVALKLDGSSVGTQVGQQSPDFLLLDTLGNHRGLYDELSKSTGVVLYFTMWSPVNDVEVSHMRAEIMPLFPDVSFFLVDFVSGSVLLSRDAQLSNGFADIETLVDANQIVFNLYQASMGTTVVIDNTVIVRMNEYYKDGTKLTDVLTTLN